MRVEFKAFAVIAIFFCCMFLWLQQGEPFSFLVEVKESEKQEAAVKMVSLTRGDQTIEIELETYLKGVVGSEMSPSSELEALKAQAVAARTFVASRDYKVDDTTASQVYMDDTQLQAVWKEDYTRSKEQIERAVEETKGEIMVYEGEPITAFFFASSAGKTANSEEYYTQELPYLRSVESPWDEEVDTDYISTYQCTKEELRTALGIGEAISSIGEPLCYESGYVRSIDINKQSYRGRAIREALGLRSSCVDLSVQGDELSFTIYGSGHGVGMSQEGAQGMALEGKGYEEILKHYYCGIQLENVYKS